MVILVRLKSETKELVLMRQRSNKFGFTCESYLSCSRTNDYVIDLQIKKINRLVVIKFIVFLTYRNMNNYNGIRLEQSRL